MRVRLYTDTTIKNYATNNPQCNSALSAWLRLIKTAEWNYPVDILRWFPSADLLGNGSNRVVFDILGNRYRIICRYDFNFSAARLFVCWIGTHTQYTRLCDDRRQFTIWNY